MKAFNLVASCWDFYVLAYTDVRVPVAGLAVVGLDVVGFLVAGSLAVGFAFGFLVKGAAVGLANDGIIVVGVAVGWLVTYLYSRSHHNITSLNAVYAYTMIHNVRSDVEVLSGPTFLMKEAELLNAS